jgi:hypothetical protein
LRKIRSGSGSKGTKLELGINNMAFFIFAYKESKMDPKLLAGVKLELLASWENFYSSDRMPFAQLQSIDWFVNVRLLLNPIYTM